MKVVSLENLSKYNELLNQKTVRSVNSVKPDSNGNVQLGTEKSTFNKVVYDTGYFSIGTNATYKFDLTGSDLENVPKENVNIRLVAKVTTAHYGFEVDDIAQLTTGFDANADYDELDVCSYIRGNTLYLRSGANTALCINNGTGWMRKPNVQIKAVLTAFVPDDGSILLIAEDQTNTSKLIGLPDGTLTWGDKNIVRSVNGTNADANGNIAITSVANATKATQDASGNNIVNTYATKSSLSSAQTTLQNNINLVIQRIDKHEGSSAGSANARYAEKDMTDYFNTGALSTAIANNNFSELSVGNFITKNVVVNGTTYSNVKFYLAHFDYYYNFGDTATTKHHVLILPATILGTAVMNDTNTTEGGYLNSKMRKTTLPLYSAGYQSAFGSAHILGWRNLVTNNVDKTVGSSGHIASLGATQNWEWADAVCELMSESMVYGAPVWSSSGHDAGSLNQQLALFRFNTSAIPANRNWYWLRNVHSSAYFCLCGGSGFAHGTNASAVYGVRPFALLI